MEYLFSIVPSIAEGLKITLFIFFGTIVFALPSGLLLAILHGSPIRIIRLVVEAYVYVMRGTPLMLQILLIYFGLPFINIKIDAIPVAIIAFTMNYAAYLCEIFRGGLQGVSRGQFEAAKVLGLSYKQMMRFIILPQMVKKVLPPLANETITLLKDTSLVYVLAVNDVLRITRTIVQRDFDMTAFVVAGVFYLGMTFVLTQLYKYLENHYNRYSE